MAEETRPSPFAPIKINLVEREGWKKYDTASGGLEWASDSGWEDFKHMDLGTMEGLIDDISHVPPKGKKKSKLDFSSEQLEYLAEQLKDGNEKLEEVQRMIVDAATWMYEAAAIPTDGDITSAMEKATEDFESSAMDFEVWAPIYSDNVRRGPMEWSPRKRYDLEEIWKQLSKQIVFEREKDHWDRYLIFDFWEAKITHEVFSIYKGAPDVYKRLKSEFESLSERHTSDVLKKLGKIMADVDVNNRTDWRASWKSMLTVGEPWAAQKELVEVLKDMPEEEAEDA